MRTRLRLNKTLQRRLQTDPGSLVLVRLHHTVESSALLPSNYSISKEKSVDPGVGNLCPGGKGLNTRAYLSRSGL